MSNRHYRISELVIETDALYKRGVHRGKLTGFQCLKESFSVVEGTTLYLYAPPWTSKTWMKYEILLQLSEYYGWKHAIFDPETGSPAEIVRYLTEMVVRKDYYNTYNNQMTHKERVSAEAFLHMHFFIIDGSEDDFSIKEFYTECELIENLNDIKLNTTSIDPFDDINHNYEEFGQQGMGQEYLTEVLKYSRKQAKEHNWYNIIVTHLRDQDIVFDKETNLRYYPPCTAREIAGGQAWFRKGMSMVGMWKAPEGLRDQDTGVPYEGNEILWLPHKQKPQGVADTGNHTEPVTLYLDYKSHRIYEKLGTQTSFASNPDKWEYNNPF